MNSLALFLPTKFLQRNFSVLHDTAERISSAPQSNSYRLWEWEKLRLKSLSLLESSKSCTVTTTPPPQPQLDMKQRKSFQSEASFIRAVTCLMGDSQSSKLERTSASVERSMLGHNCTLLSAVDGILRGFCLIPQACLPTGSIWRSDERALMNQSKLLGTALTWELKGAWGQCLLFLMSPCLSFKYFFFFLFT